MPLCSFRGCKNKQPHHPRTPQQLQLWLNSLNIHTNAKDFRLCAEHFEESDFERDLKAELLGLNRKRKLKKDAVPKRKIPRTSTSPQRSSTSPQRISEPTLCTSELTCYLIQRGLHGYSFRCCCQGRSLSVICYTYCFSGMGLLVSYV